MVGPLKLLGLFPGDARTPHPGPLCPSIPSGRCRGDAGVHDLCPHWVPIILQGCFSPAKPPETRLLLGCRWQLWLQVPSILAGINPGTSKAGGFLQQSQDLHPEALLIYEKGSLGPHIPTVGKGEGNCGGEHGRCLPCRGASGLRGGTAALPPATGLPCLTAPAQGLFRQVCPPMGGGPPTRGTPCATGWEGSDIKMEVAAISAYPQAPWQRRCCHYSHAGSWGGCAGRKAVTAPCPPSSQLSLGWLNPSPSCPLAQDMKPGGRDKKFRHSMNFPADLMEGVQAQGVEQRLVYIYIHSPCIFQVSRRSSQGTPQASSCSSIPAPSLTPCRDAWGG